MIAAAEEAGHLTPKIRRQLRLAGPDAFDTTVTVQFSDLGKPWTYRPPPAGATTELTADESFETAMRTCTGLGQGGA